MERLLPSREPAVELQPTHREAILEITVVVKAVKVAAVIVVVAAVAAVVAPTTEEEEATNRHHNRNHHRHHHLHLGGAADLDQVAAEEDSSGQDKEQSDLV